MARALERGPEPRTVSSVAPFAAGGAEHAGYVVARHQGKVPKLFCVPLESGGEALLVFSSRGAALDFLSDCAFEPEWYAMRCSAAGVISLLVGPCADIDWVLLDPFPGCLADADGPANLMHWHRCVDHLLG